MSKLHADTYEIEVHLDANGDIDPLFDTLAIGITGPSTHVLGTFVNIPKSETARTLTSARDQLDAIITQIEGRITPLGKHEAILERA